MSKKLSKKSQYYKAMMDDFIILYRKDRKRVGKPSYQGRAYFHAYEYRHLLRGYGDFKEWAGSRKLPRSWRESYRMIHTRMLRAGLDVSGFSEAHTKIIANVLGFDESYMVKVYHKGG